MTPGKFPDASVVTRRLIELTVRAFGKRAKVGTHAGRQSASETRSVGCAWPLPISNP